MAATAAMKEEALMGLWQEARELSFGSGPEVDRLDSPPSPLRFLREYVCANKPCVISGAAFHWPATSRWFSDSYLCDAMRDKSVSVHLTPDGRADALVRPQGSCPTPASAEEADEHGLVFASALVERMSFPEALRLIVSSGDHASPVVAYAQEQNDCFRSEYSALSDDVESDIPWATEALGCHPEAVNLWIGNGRSETSFHKDHYENLYAVVSGQKHFLLLPPTEVHRLYVRPYRAARYVVCPSSDVTGSRHMKLQIEEPERSVPWCSVDPYLDSSLKFNGGMPISSFPLYFNGPKPFKCTVKAGDILYLPSMWFHHVRQTPDDSGRVIAVNYWYDMRFDMKYAYYCFLQSIQVQSCDRGCDKEEDTNVSLQKLQRCIGNEKLDSHLCRIIR